ncbi:hypothetical protein TNCV_2259541 [Trichonephila clavipes]|nr:hypothetical protein TNCV_2259541 [Trichonephila clavipes]
MNWFHPTAVQFFVHGTTPKGVVDVWESRAARVMDAAIPNVLQSVTFIWIKKTQGFPSEGVSCAWMAAEEAIGSTRAFLTMWRSFYTTSVVRGCPDTGLRVNDISRSHPLVTTPPQNTIRAA